MSKIGFGLHKDKDWEEVPNDYLIWAEQNFKGNSLTLAQAELERRKAVQEGTGFNAKYSRDEFAEQLMKVIMKMPDGLNNQKVQANGYEITIRKIF